MTLCPGERKPVPLAYVWSRMFAKPSTGPVSQWKYCEKPINWYHIMRKSDNSLDVHSSNHGWNKKTDDFRFAVAVRRQNFPLDVAAAGKDVRAAPSPSSWIQPAHLITFVSPIVVVNLLPCHLKYRLKGSNTGDNDVKPGKESCVSVGRA